MSKQKNKDNKTLDIKESSFDQSFHIFAVLRDITLKILSTTQLYEDSIFEFILSRISTSIESKNRLNSNNVFLITQDEFNLATKDIQFNPRLTTILSLSFNIRQPATYEQLSYSLPLCITTLALLHPHLKPNSHSNQKQEGQSREVAHDFSKV